MPSDTSRRNGSHSSPSSNRFKGTSALNVPYDSDAERALAACVLLDPMAAKDECLDLIHDELFMHPGYRQVVSTVKLLIKKGEAVDLVSVYPHLHDSMDAIDLAHLYGETVPSAAAIMTHYRRVVEVYRRRKYWELGVHLVKTSTTKGAGEESEKLRLQCENTIEVAERMGALPRVHSVAEVLPDALQEIRPESERDDSECIPLGLPSLDEMLVGGLRPGKMYVLAARPSVGKTTLAMNMAANIALQDRPVLFISLETMETNLLQGLLARGSGVNSYHLLRGTYDEEGRRRLLDAAEKIERLPLYTCDDPRVTIGSIRTMVRASRTRHKIQAVFVDYLQLIRPENPSDPRHVQVSEISREIKLLSMEQHVPIVVLCQLNRKAEAREGNKPMLSDLRESGSIEQDADTVGLLYRPDYYKEDDDDPEKLTELIVAKQRQGPRGTIRLRYNPAVGDFTDWDDGGLD